MSIVDSIFNDQCRFFETIISKQIVFIYSEEHEKIACVLINKLNQFGNTITKIQYSMKEYVDKYIPSYNKNGNLDFTNLRDVACDIIFFITPFLNINKEEQVFNSLNTLERQRGNVIYFDWPCNCIYQTLTPLVEKVYQQALQTDYAFILKKNKELKTLLENGQRFHLIDENGTSLHFKRYKYKVLCESGIYDRNHTIQQLPGGETFIPVDSNKTNGVIVFDIGNYKKALEVKNGFIHMSKLSNKYEDTHICEFGLGTNPNVKYIKNFSISEKAYGTCHLGFGNNLSFGGVNKYPYHYDIVFSNFKLYIDGNKVQLYL